MASRQIKIFALIPIIVELLMSCTAQKVPFTPDIQTTYNFSEERLKTVQFYTSDPIILYVNKNNNVSNIVRGKVIINESDVYDRIIIPKNTPCILVKKLDNDKLIVSFETGNGKQICFVNNGNSYSLGAKEWADAGLLKYGGKNYFTMNRDTYLMIKVKKLNRILRKERTIKGRTI